MADPRVKWLLETVAARLDCGSSDILLEFASSNNIIPTLLSFFTTSGPIRIIFHFLDQNEEERLSFSKRFSMHLDDIPALPGRSCYVLRITDKDVPLNNVTRDILVGSLTTDSLSDMISLLQNVYIPALSNNENWGAIRDEQKKTFLSSFDRFALALTENFNCVSEGVDLPLPQMYDLHTTSNFNEAAANPEIVRVFEQSVEEWTRIVQRILAESNQVRSESSDTGPQVELEFWKKRMATFNSITEQLKRDTFKTILNVLHVARSHILIEWRKYEVLVTDAANESKDNVRFLYTIDKLSACLFATSPVEIGSQIEGLINAIGMMHSVARFYNTSERLTSLFFKITNQMISSCRKYLETIGSVWSNERNEFIERCKQCIALNLKYQNSYHKVKLELASKPRGRHFDLSEAYIFGSFDMFSHRLNKIIDLLTTMNDFAFLKEMPLPDMPIGKFERICLDLRTKSYDFLDYRNKTFDTDYKTFNQNIYSLELLIQNKLSNFFNEERVSNRTFVVFLDLLIKVKNLVTRKNLQTFIQSKFQLFMEKFNAYIDFLRKYYNGNFNSPPVARNLPRISGSIIWVRNLLLKLEMCIELFQKEAPKCLNARENRHIIRNYNRLLQTFIEFETIYYDNWLNSISEERKFLFNTILQQRNNVVVINFDPTVFKLLKEIRWLKKLGFDISEDLLNLSVLEDELLEHHSLLKYLVTYYNNITEKIVDQELSDLFSAVLIEINRFLIPSLTTITWNSIGLKEYLEQLHDRLCQLDHLVDEVVGFLSFRINSSLSEIKKSILVELVSDVVYSKATLNTFIVEVKDQLDESVNFLSDHIQSIENAVLDLINMLIPTAENVPEVETDDVAEESKKEKPKNRLTVSDLNEENPSHSVFIAFYNDFREKCYKQVLDSYTASLQNLHSALTGDKTIFSLELSLSEENLDLAPTVSEITTLLHTLVKLVIESTKTLRKWDVEYTEYDELKEQISSTHERIISLRKSNNILYRKELTRLENVHEELLDELYSYSLFGYVTSNINFLKHVLSVHSSIVSIDDEIDGYYRNLDKYAHFYEKELLCDVKEISLIQSEEPEGETTVEVFETLYSFKNEKELIRITDVLESYFELDRDITDMKIDTSVRFMSIALGTYQAQLKNLLLCRRVALLNKLYEFAIHESTFVKNQLQSYCSGMNEFLKGYEGKEINEETINLEALKDIIILQSTLNLFNANYEYISIPLEAQFELLVNYCNNVESPEVLYLSEVSVFSAVKNDQSVISPVEFTSGDMMEELTNVSTLYSTQKSLLTNINHFLFENQKTMKRTLVKNVGVLQKDVRDYYKSYDETGPMRSDLTPEEAIERLALFKTLYKDKERRWKVFNIGEEIFNLDKSDFPRLNDIKRQLNLLDSLYGLYTQVNHGVMEYYEVLWVDKDLEQMMNEVSDYQGKLRKLPSTMRTWDAYISLKERLDALFDEIPLLQMIGNPSMRARHWEAINNLFSLVDSDVIDPESNDFKLRDLLSHGLITKAEEIEEICNGSVKEADIETKLAALDSQWRNQMFVFQDYKSRGPLMLKPSETSELVALLEDSQLILSGLISSRYNAPFKEDIVSWIQKLSICSERIDAWLSVQFLWAYLEAVFSSGDISAQLPQEAKRFANIDRSWVKIMNIATQEPNVISLLTSNDTLANLLPHLTEQLELCQKSLNYYLEKKRTLFPRFYFISDAQLLEILGQASDPNNVQAHLLSIFDNVNEVKFSRKRKNEIIGMISKGGEKVPLVKKVVCSGPIEGWLNQLVNAMQLTVKAIARMCSYELQDVLKGEAQFNLREFVARYPGQIGLVGVQMLWTATVEESLRNSRVDKNAVQAAVKHSNTILREMIEMTTEEYEFKRDRRKIETLVTIQVHQRDIVDHLYKTRIRSPFDFEWLKQTRFYWRYDKDCALVSITDVDFTYNNEYLGCADRLVITPLTDRCYITLAQALALRYGGAPAGPAGTGKTETVKDMAKGCLGNFCLVVNASDQMSVAGLGKIFKGISQSGVWGDFDEFNRILLPVLSVVAQQISCILNALKTMQDKYIFTDGTEVGLVPTCGIFITMNPGYAGRQELPENLKVLFRSVAMMVPDAGIIMRVKFAASGFQENVILSQKFDLLYSLCKQQLSAQRHYDFGLRNILSVLRTCGVFRRRDKDASETDIFLRVVRDMNLSKLVGEDVQLFLALLDDLFPGCEIKTQHYTELEAAIAKHISEAGLTQHAQWISKIVQLYESQNVRHGNFILGKAGTGKTRLLEILEKSLTTCGTPTKEIRLNPKAFTDSQMFGIMNAKTGDWKDGVFSVIWKKTAKRAAGEDTWLVLDGPVDTIWIESLNTVLDDNRTLTLANGDRIPMSGSMRIMFEVHSLANASPATVSRCGMVYVAHTDLGWLPVHEAWVEKCHNNPAFTGEIISEISRLVDQTVQPALDYIFKELDPVMDMFDVSLLQQCHNLLDAMIPQFKKSIKRGLDHVIIQRIFSLALIWSLGCALESEDRRKLHAFLKSMSVELPVLKKPGEESVYDYWLNSTSGEWVHWSGKVPEYRFPTDHTPGFESILVPTVDNIRTETLISLMHSLGKYSLLLGEPGTAKTVTIQNYVRNLMNEKENLDFKSIGLSFFTTPELMQRTIESLVEKRLGTTYGPKANKKMCLFLDDINLPEINSWGDTPTNELVRQLLEYDGFYCLDRPGDWKSFVDLHFFAAMQTPGGGRNDIPERLKRHFSMFNCTLPTRSSVIHVFSSILCGYFTSEGIRAFSNEVQQAATKVITLTYELWSAVKGKMLPTPDKFHYMFNLRDLSRIVQGMLRGTNESVKNPTDLFLIWKHEAERVLPDRFTNYSDIEWYNERLNGLVENELSDQYPETVEPLCKPVFFGDFLEDAPEPTGDEEKDKELENWKPKYLHTDEDQFVRKRLEGILHSHNELNRRRKLDLVLFYDAVCHLIRIIRIIRTPGGHALLVGVGGSGKQSLTRLASFACGYQYRQIAVTKTYTISNLLEDMQINFKIAGVENKGVTLVFTDKEIKEEFFLEYINNILTSGEIPGLFPKDEVDVIIGDITNDYKRENPRAPLGNDDIWKFFLQRVRKNFHIVLCFSPVGDKFRNRARKFPGLISGCTIDWFHAWPKEALIEVASRFISDFEIVVDDEDVRGRLVEHIAWVHDDMIKVCDDYFQRFRKPTYVTPKSYLSFIKSFMGVYSEKHEEIRTLADRLNSGLKKLKDASAQIAVMKDELDVKKEKLKEAQKESEKILVTVTAQQQAAQSVTEEVQQYRNTVAAEAAVVNDQKESAERDLLAAKPALDAAEAALDSITSGDISTLRRLLSPPNLIKRLMDGVLILCSKPLVKWSIDKTMLEKGQTLPNASWEASLSMMAQGSFLNTLKTYSKESITDEMCELLEPYLAMPDFTVEAARSSSGNVAGLCEWIRSMTIYHQIAKEVAPKIKTLRIAEIKMKEANAKLQEAENQLETQRVELAKVQAVYDNAVSHKKALEEDAMITERRMNAANQLISGLSGERKRWSRESAEFEETIRRLIGDVSLATAFLSYSGPFNAHYRQLLMNDHWKTSLIEREVPFSKDFNLINFLTSDAQVGEWNLQGLPTDDLSTQNGIISTTADRYPLLIDPQSQAVTWIKNKERENNLVVTKFTDKLFKRRVEEALEYGYPCLVEDVREYIDPMIDPVLDKQFVKLGANLKVRFGDKECDVLKGFTLYLTTNLANPHYSPEVFAKACIINFTVTLKGLEDQLLGNVILHEKKELEESRQKLLEEVNHNKKTIMDLENNLIERLANASDNLLDDISLIDVLNKTKSTSKAVLQQLETAKVTEEKINQAREEFRVIATRGSILYFLIVEMAEVSNMYQTSLKQFLERFFISLRDSPQSKTQSNRIQNIVDYLTDHVHEFISQGLFGDHKQLFVMQLVLKIQLNSGKISFNDFQTFLKAGATVDRKSAIKKTIEWIPDSIWLNILALRNISLFSNLHEQISTSPQLWRQWYNVEDPEVQPIPGNYSNLTEFQRLLLIRCIRPDRTMLAAQLFIKESLGPKFIESSSVPITSTFKETSHNVPAIFLLSLGADPSNDITDLAKKCKMTVSTIAMGQGQEVPATKAIQEKRQLGGWVLLQNCHLSLEMMREVEQQIPTWDSSNTHEDFRLWLTCEPHPEFPIGLLQLSIKVACEPPQGLKAGLKRTFDAFNSDILDQIDKPQWKPLLYTLCFVHSIVQERRKFGPLGWNIPYEFNTSDLSASVQFLQNMLYNVDSTKSISWSTMRYMICEVHYGGRITDDYDRRLMNYFGIKYLNDNVLQGGYTYSEGYTIPRMKKMTELKEFIDHLPTNDLPEVFGLHSNADITYRTKQSDSILATILDVQPKDVASGGATREDIVDAKCGDMLQTVPKAFNNHEFVEAINKQSRNKPLTVFLRQEVERYQVLLSRIHQDLSDMRLAIAGTIVMSEYLQALLNSLFDARVPDLWQKLSWSAANLGEWLTDVDKRFEQYNIWLFQGRPKMYWLGGFYNPTGFLTSVKQEISRMHQGWALDTLNITTTLLDNFSVRHAPEQGVYIYGLQLEGAHWDIADRKVNESLAREILCPLPVLHVDATDKPTSMQNQYCCPVYFTRTRRNYIFDIYLPSNKPQIHWVIRGVAATLTER
ncbi:hypothetical protein PCE1_001406 [Barthelona sp. PCE]